MKGVLLKKLIGLGRDEDGAALVITLALFMFLYAACAGVFAIGQTVKDKIHLQNACDAAAYSAAVVQADTLSRIATINRAMSWTYACLCRREMDYITYRWLEHTCEHYDEDRDYVTAEGRVEIGSIPLVYNKNVLLRSHDESEGVVESAVDDFPKSKLAHESFYAGTGKEIGVLERQILADKDTIVAMGVSIDRLISDLPRKATDAGRGILELNLATSESCRCRIAVTNDYFAQPCEARFLAYSGNSLSSDWYELVDPGDAEKGFWREYKTDKLKSQWYWWVIDPFTEKPHPAIKCPHECSYCHDEILLVCRHAWLTAGALKKKYGEEYYTGSKDGIGARPKQLDERFFGKGKKGETGTITVGVAKYNENPWTVLFRGISGFATDGERDGKFGIYGLFNPYRHVEWSWAISSAKAGYQHVDEDPAGLERKYRVNYDSNEDVNHYSEEDVKWNLCTSDWDAVFVPVRKSHAFAGPDETWNSAGSDFLRDFVEGDWEPLGGPSSAPTYNIVGNMPNLPLMHNGGGTYRNLNWSRLADLMFH